MTDEERFMEHVSPEPMSGCWIWTAALRRGGYGRFWEGNKAQSAHRVAYKMYRGPIPGGLQLDHLCRVRCCVNPAHMEIVNNRTNILRGISFSARNASKTHCKWGHEFTQVNTYPRSRHGGRGCKQCRCACDRARRKRKQARRVEESK